MVSHILFKIPNASLNIPPICDSTPLIPLTQIISARQFGTNIADGSNKTLRKRITEMGSKLNTIAGKKKPSGDC